MLTSIDRERRGFVKRSLRVAFVLVVVPAKRHSVVVHYR